jgi:hypothetical protein
VSTAPYAADLVAERLGWDEAETRRQIGVYLHRVDVERLSQVQGDDRDPAAELRHRL